MCGVCGIAGFRDDGLLEQMTSALAHRGPDSAGYLRTDHVSLGHRRLSIIDVAGGQQPIFNEDESVCVICNGEIYNYRELREELRQRGHSFRTQSDSEVILHAYEEYGPDGCLRRLAGMFAFAVYDARERRLFVARDRVGVKPLYYVEHAGRLLFASEMKALMRYAELAPTLNHRAVHDYLSLRYVPGPGGMFHEISKFPAGHYGLFSDGRLKLHRYWRPELYDGPYSSNEDEYLEGFAEHFERSIRRRLISDVPLGAYLSGGLDSSVIVAAMSRITSQPVRTFTVGFDYAHDELKDAAETACMLGCRHTAVECRVQDVSLLPEIVYHLDEPVGDAIVIPMYLLAREARKDVTVVLTGEGADEILGGYLFHKVLLTAHHLARAVPRAIRNGIFAPALSAVPAGVLDKAFNYPGSLGERGKQKLLDFMDLLEPDQVDASYRHLISLFDQRDTDALYSPSLMRNTGGNGRSNSGSFNGGSAPWLNRVLHLQFDHWLPDDILMKQDKLSMAHALEARVPFLDHEFVEYVLRLPPNLKIRGRQSKLMLRRYAQRLLPQAVTARRKQPFYAPIETYLKDSRYRDLVEDTLSEKSVRERGLFRPEAVAALRHRMHAGEFVYVKQVFSLVVLELWMRMAVDRRGLP